MRNLVLLLCCFFSLLHNGNCQLTIKGKTYDKGTKSPISGANVYLYKSVEDSDIIAFDITNKDGEFEISTSTASNIDSVLLAVTFLGYTKYVHQINNALSNLTIALTPENFSLREVTVKATGITQRHDTVSYLVSSFADKQDRTIADVLRKLPGVDVSNNGTISYQGKPINRFYIEGLDAMGGKYSLATESIPPNYVASVQVIENHQPVKALRGKEYIDRAALNLTLKDNAKSKWVGTTNLGLGIPLVSWDAQLLLMEIARKHQSLNMYKGNNIGNDVTAQAQSHTLEDLLQAADNSVDNTQMFTIPDTKLAAIDDARALFNKSQQVGITNAKNIKPDLTLKSSLTYSNSRITQQRNTNYWYFINPDSTLNIREARSQQVRKQLVDGEITFSNNSANFFLNNKLKGGILLNKNVIEDGGTSNITQQFSTPCYNLQNELRLIRQLGRATFKVSTYNLLDNKPSQLSVNRDKTDNSFGNALASKLLVQKVSLNSFLSNNTISSSWGYRKWTLEGALNLRYLYQGLTSSLNPTSSTSITFENSCKWQTYRLKVNPTISYNGDKLKLMLLPACYLLNLNLKDRIHNELFSNTSLYFSPELSAQYELSNFWEVRARYSINNQHSDFTSMTTGLILQDYRTLYKGSTSFMEGHSESFMVGLSYRNPVNMLFVSTSLTFAPLASNISFAQEFIGLYQLKNVVFEPRNTDFWLVSGKVGRLLDWKKVNVSLRLTASKINSQIYQHQLRTPSTNYSITIEPDFNLSPSKWLNLEYGSSLLFNQLKIAFIGNSTNSSIRRLNQKFSAYIFPLQKIQVKGTIEHYSVKGGPGLRPNTYFTDLGIRYTATRVELSLDCYNIFNQKNYAYSNFSQLSQTTTTYNLRSTSAIISAFIKF